MQKPENTDPAVQAVLTIGSRMARGLWILATVLFLASSGAAYWIAAKDKDLETIAANVKEIRTVIVSRLDDRVAVLEKQVWGGILPRSKEEIEGLKARITEIENDKRRR